MPVSYAPSATRPGKMMNTISRRFSFLLAGALFAVTSPCAVWAQAWPTRPVTMIVPFPAGGAPDLLARVLAQELANKLGQQFGVDNRTGASGNIGAAAAARAAPDGYTILVSTPG